MKYGFIGCGNMGGSIAKALANSTKNIILADPTEKAAILARQLGCTTGDNETVVSTCDCVFLAVKPQVMADVLAPLQPLFAKHKPLIVSMAAGITVEKIENLIP
jgi:pyrroline-5-carboxylate reductase